MNRWALGLLVFAAATLLVGCGGAPDDDRLLGFSAKCADGTFVTNLDEDGCDHHGGVDETYIGGHGPKPEPFLPSP